MTPTPHEEDTTMTTKTTHTPRPLYHHQTDGGAEYLCVRPVMGTTEGDVRFAAVRLDGQPELLGAYAAAPSMYEALDWIIYEIDKGTHDLSTIRRVAQQAKAEAEGRTP